LDVGKEKFNIDQAHIQLDTTTTAIRDMAIADYNNDQKFDIAMASYRARAIEVFINNGDDTFTSKYTSVPNVSRITAGDVNNDFFEDIILLGDYGSYTLLLGNGTGTFTQQFIPSITTTIFAPFAATFDLEDFDQDGDLDLLLIDGLSVELHENDGAGTFSLLSTIITSGQPSSVLISDNNKDGKADILIRNFIRVSSDSYYWQVNILYGFGDGTFADPVSVVTSEQGINIKKL